MNNYCVEINHLTKFYNDFCVLDSINFNFEHTKFYSIKGDSGSGKSTLLNLLSGVDSPNNGKIFFNKKNINSFDDVQKVKYLNEDLGIIFQDPFLIRELTILENVIIKGLIKKLDYKYCVDKAYNLLKKINLEDKANEFPSNLSIGQQQRISILRAIFNEPKFLLADEPTANLDKNSKKQIIDLVNNMENISLIVATHDMDIINQSNIKLKIENKKLIKC